ncbi:hypothetical protein [Sphingopyxis fribergensis]
MQSENGDKARELAIEFEGLCAEILSGAGYTIKRELKANDELDGGWRFDFVAVSPNNDSSGLFSPRLLIDVKWMPLPEANLRVARNLASLYAPQRWNRKDRRPLLILSASVPEMPQGWIESDFDLEVWDREKLLQMARGDVATRLRNFIERSDQWHAEVKSTPHRVRALPLDELAAEHAELRAERQDAFALALASDPTEDKVTGKHLCDELKKIPRGKKGAKALEEITSRIFAFLFPGDLVQTEPATKRTEDGLNIYDLVFQIRNRTEFWTSLARDMRSRVLLVECKNYASSIKAMQIYTTERYLSPSALRAVALIVTRAKPHPTAIAAASGALRDSGKLILILDEEALCLMLHARDLQRSSPARAIDENDPAEIINSRLHHFLATLPR